MTNMEQHILQARITKSFVSNITFMVVSLVLQLVAFGMWFYTVVEASVALVLLVLALVLYDVIRLTPCVKTELLPAAVYLIFLSTFISGILAIIASSRFGFAKIDIEGRLVLAFPVMNGLGGLIACLLSLGIVCGLKPCKTASLSPPTYEMSAQPAAATNAGQQQSEYINEGQFPYPNAGQTTSSCNSERHTSKSYSRQPQSKYMYQGQPSAIYGGQQNPEYNDDGHPQAAYASQPNPGYIHESQSSAAYAGQQEHEGQLSVVYTDQANPRYTEQKY